MKRPLLFILLGLGVLAIVFGGFAWNWVAAKRAGPEALGNVPSFSLPAATAEGASAVSLADLQGKIWVANFIFTHCSGPCPLMTSKMAKLQGVLPDSVQLITFTVDPDRDDLDVLSEYARQFEADPKRWFFLRAEKPVLYKLVFEGFKLPMMEDPSADSGFRVTHSTRFVLVDGQGRIRGYFESSDPSLEKKMTKAVQDLTKEMS
ncbi:MAG: SCO family protein [Elusimicrobia bacterium]|jgi:protein SCO1/2|nr:SCO family protein [Elusimicrobiota bacterium]